ncbi:gliding motility-associated ABC transporter substrate-binding protein GldG [Mongoliibacter ruber]|uniref:Gliding-associated putative ABC transporter substrate-binding component GldG n=1 Tax=Mongoliibacter ruber TaxID=1750599 RepID=A0A2T0WQT6_9BACT|nr:gliding motility-associated ABC transporter substrate-binding protein GldG [Mongoliibacter ruber]PRY89059.1 gliding-associated putative ABC transporter substrate-binding component GldG [Mongoliibacter ruber]
MKNKSDINLLKQIGIPVFLLLILWLVGKFFPFRIDLTEEKRYSLHPATIEVLQQIDEPLEVEILLTGNLPGGMRRLQRSVEETIRTFNAYSNKKIAFFYLDPMTLPADLREDYIVGLSDYGINPTNLFITEDGGQKSKLIFPGIVVRNEEFETGALILRGEKGMGPDQILNQSIENLEFELANAIKKLIRKQQYSVGMLMGNGEMEEDDGYGIIEALVEDFEVYKIPMEQAQNVEDLDPFAAIIIPGPKQPYNEREIYILDQYLMNGGNLVFLIDALAYEMEDAGGEGTVAMPFDNGLDQMLFRYGIRINKDFIQDMNFGYHPVMAGNFGDQEQLIPLPWPFYISAGRMASHPVTKGLDQVMFRFVSSMDTVKAEGVIKTPLIFSSDFSRKIAAPVRLAFEDMADGPNLDEFRIENLPLLYLLEGNFTSLYKNRFLPEGADQSSFLDSGTGGRVMVAGTGNVFKSQLNFMDGSPLPLGEDPFNNTQYANRQLLLNSINYLLEPEGIISSRTKQFQIRPLNKVKLRDERQKWQIINIALPVLLILVLGLIWTGLRKRRFSK